MVSERVLAERFAVEKGGVAFVLKQNPSPMLPSLKELDLDIESCPNNFVVWFPTQRPDGIPFVERALKQAELIGSSEYFPVENLTVMTDRCFDGRVGPNACRRISTYLAYHCRRLPMREYEQEPCGPRLKRLMEIVSKRK